MNSELKLLAKEYIDNVTNVCLLMLKGLNLTSKNDLRHHKMLHPMGDFYLNGNNRYVFHGRGCRFSNDDIIIDWDFGYDDRWCGINPWLFADYLKANNKNLLEFFDGNKINKECEEAVIRGEMVKKYDLYYFV